MSCLHDLHRANVRPWIEQACTGTHKFSWDEVTREPLLSSNG